MGNCYTMEDYENAKKAINQQWEERMAAKRREILEKKKRIADRNERIADAWFFITPGEVLSTNVGTIKVAKKAKSKNNHHLW